ncbi:MAG: biopolymer transporter ExbD [Holosporales bacterium]|jgi:biopolymer transport protein TolR|nr:biopolymer transporter ExbD [Holosporales bacterium]
MNSRRTKRQKPSININVAPLVEVMLVLIIIFMITAPMLNVGIQVDLPKTKASSIDETKSTHIVVSINRDSEIFIEEAKISIEDLIQKLPMILADGKSDTIYIRGDKNLQYGAIMEIMGIISTAGACKVSLISDPDDSLVIGKTIRPRTPKNWNNSNGHADQKRKDENSISRGR